MNSNWDLFRVDEGGALYLRDDTHWLSASSISGPWMPVTTLLALLTDLPDDGNWADACAAMPPEAYKDGDCGCRLFKCECVYVCLPSLCGNFLTGPARRRLP